MASEQEILSILKDIGAAISREPKSLRPYYWVLAEYSVDILESAARAIVEMNKEWYQFPIPGFIKEQCERHKGAGYVLPPYMDALLNYYNYTPEELEIYARSCDNEGAVSCATALRKRAQFVRDGFRGGPQPCVQERDLSQVSVDV